MDKIIFELNNCFYSYLNKYPALCDISMGIKAGEKITVIGANGSGKSTLLQMFDGLIFPDQGTIRFRGENITADSFRDDNFLREFRRKVGLVFQNPEVQLFCPTVRDDILFGPLQLGAGPIDAQKSLERIAALFRIEHLLDRQPHQLSIGEKKKVALATTFILNPEILILDEPTAGIDPLTTRQIIDSLIAANALGVTIITATHDLHIVEEISDVVYVLGQDKRLARAGAADEILGDFQFLEKHNLLHIHSHYHQDKVHRHPHLHIDHHHNE